MVVGAVVVVMVALIMPDPSLASEAGAIVAMAKWVREV